MVGLDTILIQILIEDLNMKLVNRKKITSVKKTKHFLIGGPYSGELIVNGSHSGTTLIFSAKGMIGFYRNCVWVDKHTNINI